MADNLRLVLASASPRRADLLAQIGVVPDDIAPTDIDESLIDSELPRPYAQRVSLAKASYAAETAADTALILAADTVVSVGRRILDKPANADEARKHLTLLSGRRHRVTTGLALIRTSDARQWTRLVETQVKFKRLSSTEIDGYLTTGEWLGKAGGYAIQGFAGQFVPSISGSYSNVVGLPLTETAGLLEAAGFRWNWPGSDRS